MAGVRFLLALPKTMIGEKKGIANLTTKAVTWYVRRYVNFQTHE